MFGGDRSLYYGQPINRAHPLNRGLVGCWIVVPWYKSGQRLIDLSGLRTHGTLTNGPMWSGLAPPGGFGSVSFDGSDDYVDCGSSATLAPAQISVSAWIKSNATIGAFDGLMSKSNTAWTAGWGWHWSSSTRLRFWIENWSTGDAFVDFASEADTQTWHHVCGTWDGAMVRCHLDAKNQGNERAYGGALTSTHPLEIGRTAANANNFLGLIDSVQIRARAVSTAEVAALYDDARRGYPETLNWLSTRSYLLPDVGGAAPAGNRRRAAMQGGMQVLTGGLSA